MEVSVENTSPLGRRLKVSLPDANLADKVKGRLNKLSKEVRLKGFRPGAVPHQVMQRRFGKSVHAEVLNEVIQDSFTEALKQHHLHPTAMPKIEDIEENDDSKALAFTASFEVFPEISLTEFSEFEVEKPVVALTDEDVMNTVNKMCQQMGHWHDVERASKNGDKLKVSLIYRVEEQDPISQDDFDIMLDEKSVLPELLEALVDKKADSDFNVKTTYPDTWPDKRMTGKSVSFEGKIKAVAEKHAASQEDLCKQLNLTGDDVEQQLKDKVKSEIESQVNEMQDNLLKEKVLSLLDEKNTIDVPTSLIDQEKQAMQQEMAQQGRPHLAPEEEASFEENAQRRVVLGLLINEVVKQKNIKVDGKRVRAEIEKIGKRYGQPEEIVRAYYKNERLLHQIERQILLDQAVEEILKEAKVVDKPMSFDELMKLSEQN